MVTPNIDDVIRQATRLKNLDIADMIDSLPWHSTKRWRTRDVKDIDRIIVHQAIGANATAESMNDYHIRSDPRGIGYGRDWPHIAYHYVVERSGKIVLCNPLNAITYHTKRQNAVGVGICFCGDFDGEGHVGKNKPTAEQYKSFILLIPALAEHLGLKLSRCLFGHDDFGKPACPGREIRSWIDSMKDRS